MSPLDLLHEVKSRGIELWVEEDRLRCRAPRGAMTTVLQSRLAEYKLDLVRLLKEARSPGVGTPPRVKPDPEHRSDPFPLTDMQQAYYLGRNAGFEIGNVACHLYVEIESPSFDVQRLEVAWSKLVQRHDMLRAEFRPDGQQQIRTDVQMPPIPVTDLRHEDIASAEAHIEAVHKRLSHQVFNPERWPLFEVCLSRTATADILHVSIDGLVADGWSAVTLFHEIERYYREADAPAEPLELSFRDYVMALPGMQETLMYQRSLAYWVERARTLPPAPQLPLAIQPGSIRQPRFVRRSWRLESRDGLTKKAESFGLTPSIALLATYAEVLAYWSRSPHFTINVPRFNRFPVHPQVKEVIANFSSFTLLEVKPTEPGGSFIEHANRLRNQLMQDLDHPYLTGIEVLRHMGRVQGTGQAAVPIVFTSLIGMGSGGDDSFLVGRLGRIRRILSQTPQVWLDAQLYEESGALVMAWDAVEELFPAGMLDDMFAAFCDIVRRLAESTEAWHMTAPALIPERQLAERAAINATDGPLPDVRLQDLFAAQAAEQPDHPAVIGVGTTLSYEELDQRSSQLAGLLAQAGARPNSLVAVVMEKGWEQVVAVLGILKAGAAYLPVDPNLPAERRRFLLAHGQVRLAVTQAHLDRTLDWPAGIERFAVDALEVGANAAPPLPAAQRPDDLAYVIYTSGSTGEPKGVMVAHRSVVNAVLCANERCGVRPADRMLALTALHHDLSVYDVFGVLAAGATIVFPKADQVRDPSHWLELMERERVSLWNTVPAIMEMLVEYASGNGLPVAQSLRSVILGGDWIPVTLVDRLRALVPGVQVNSIGGPTETTIWNIWYSIGQVDPTWRSIPYGKPIINNRYYVFDEHLNGRPTWVPGEMYCGGAGVAVGYWRDPERTSAKFITHPASGERLYRTGDWGRYLPDGNIEFLGREDLQVKLRGHRIELGEIESLLLRHPGVRAATATVTWDAANPSIVAFAVLAPDERSGGASKGGEQQAKGSDYRLFSTQREVVTDEVERAQFKLSQNGLRRDPGSRKVALPAVALDDALRSRYLWRTSHRCFRPEPLPVERLAALLGCLYEIEVGGLPKYLYPSAGGLYPVQAYVVVKPDRVQGVAMGTYYYHPRDHQLVLLSEQWDIADTVHVVHNREMAREAAFTILLVGHMRAITPMYGDLAHDFAVLEAGYMGQLLMMEAPAQQLGLCPIGAIDFAAIRDRLAVEADDACLHVLCGGVPDMRPAAVAPETHDATASGSDDTARRTGESLRRYLAQKLPDHMVPTSVVVLDEMPLTPNGKVDRGALAARAGASASQSAGAAEQQPTNELEASIARVWATCLKVERVGIYDNFFDMGGTSIGVVQTYNRLREALGRDFPVVAMFKYPTVKTLAEHLGQDEAQPRSFEESYSRAEIRKRSMRRRFNRGNGGNSEQG
ncbi:amino acid adenylation domain-containing protein [Sorangium sp. So ce281]|uniref:amino acid adenylation domain-containing protein n=1 Tax=unclassified Sorangium TaxID=2621164 RepID=UPI003F5F12B7